MISVTGLHTILAGSLCDITVLNVPATTDDKSHDDARTVLRCSINSLHYYSIADILKPAAGNDSLH
jgi:hypothetical protein